MKALFSQVEFKNMNTFELEKVEQSTCARGIASDILTQHLNKAFRYLSFKAENRKSDETCLSRVYTKGKTQRVSLKDRNANLTPRYENDTRITRRYKWTMNHQQNHVDNSVSFNVVVPEVSVPVYSSDFFGSSTRSLSSEIEGRVSINVGVFLQNTQGIIHSMTNNSTTTRMPRTDGQSIVKFSANNVNGELKNALVSFDIIKI